MFGLIVSIMPISKLILHWVKTGKTNFEIGIILTISPNTVKNHLKRIFQKLDVSCRAQAVAKYAPQRLT